MEYSRMTLRLASSVYLLALAACSGGGGGNAPIATNPTNNNSVNTTTTNNTNTVTPVSIGTPDNTSTGGSTGSFNFATNPPALGTPLGLPGPVAHLTPTAITFTGVPDAVATYRGTIVSGGTTYPVFDISIPSLGVSASNVRGDNTAVALANGGQFSAAVASLNYLALGAWTYTQPGNAGVYLGQTVTGSLTPASGIPSSGSASYAGSGSNGGVVGAFFVPSGTGTIQGGALSGNVNLNVNFGTSTVNGSLTNMQAMTTANGSGTTPWNNVSLSGSLSRGSSIIMSGTTSTSGAPTGAGAPGFSSAATGSFSATFYGPNAQEAGGSWTLTESTPAGNKSAVGTFAGR